MPALLAPAKLNLGLRVTGRRSDGYHLLESLFVPLDFADSLELHWDPAADGAAQLTFTLEVAEDALPASGLPAGSENLAARAARGFLDRAGRSGHLRLRLCKRLPTAAGLGGGSSDAGAVLRGLRQLLPEAIAPDALARLALELGADVPFFLEPRPAWVSGIGAGIEHLDGIPGLWMLIANPGIPLATAEVFHAFDMLGTTLTPEDPGSTMRALPEPLGGLETLERLFDAGWLKNDLEPAARRLCPPIGRLLEQLDLLGARWVGMSGSGATVYGIFSNEASAQRAHEALDLLPPSWARVVRSLGSPKAG